jgi:fucose permease
MNGADRVQPVLEEKTRVRVDRARVALALTFAVKGLAYSAMVARLPALRETLGLSTGQLGLLLLCLSAGAIAGLPIAGPVVHRVGARGSVVAGGLTVGLGLLGIGAALLLGSTPVAAAGMVLVGLGNGVWDVAINVEGVDIERRTGRSLLPKLHGVFSIGTMAGAGVATVTAATGVALVWLLTVLMVLVPAALGVLSRRFLTDRGDQEPEKRAKMGLAQAWREPRTLVIGLLVFGFAVTEGAANDWIAIAFVDGHHADEAVGAAAYWVFVTAMTAGRLFGGRVLDRVGRVTMLRISAVTALAGLALVLFAGWVPLALAGALLWGFGAALGFPVGISSAGDGDAGRSAARVSVVSSLGYVAFLGGPPGLGLLAAHAGILGALLVVLAAPAVAFAAASAARSRPVPPA